MVQFLQSKPPPPPSTQHPTNNPTNTHQHRGGIHTRVRTARICVGSPTDEPASFRYYERALRAVPSTRASFRPSDIQHVRDYDDSQCTLYELETHNQGSYRILQSNQSKRANVIKRQSLEPLESIYNTTNATGTNRCVSWNAHPPKHHQQRPS